MNWDHYYAEKRRKTKRGERKRKKKQKEHRKHLYKKGAIRVS
jgi:hypothetical protein